MFHKCKTEGEAKKIYRELLKRVHPDHGGTQELTLLAIDAFERCLLRIKQETRVLIHPAQAKTQEDITNDLQAFAILKGDERLKIINRIDTFFIFYKTKVSYKEQILYKNILIDYNRLKYITKSQYNFLVHLLQQYNIK